jgi:hypothetical protein
MASKAAVSDFLAQRTLAVVGASRKGSKFGNTAYKELKAKGYKVIPVNPHAEIIERVAGNGRWRGDRRSPIRDGKGCTRCSGSGDSSGLDAARSRVAGGDPVL